MGTKDVHTLPGYAVAINGGIVLIHMGAANLLVETFGGDAGSLPNDYARWGLFGGGAYEQTNRNE